MLFISQQPVIESNQAVGDIMGIFDGSDHLYRVRLSSEKLLNSRHDSSRSRTMTATCVRRNDQDFWNACTKHSFPVSSLSTTKQISELSAQCHSNPKV